MKSFWDELEIGVSVQVELWLVSNRNEGVAWNLFVWDELRVRWKYSVGPWKSQVTYETNKVATSKVNSKCITTRLIIVVNVYIALLTSSPDPRLYLVEDPCADYVLHAFGSADYWIDTNNVYQFRHETAKIKWTWWRQTEHINQTDK